MTEVVTMVEALIARGYDLRDIAASVGTSKLTLKALLAGKDVDLEYRTISRIQFLYHNKERPHA